MFSENIKNPKVIFSTKCWENDWKILLKKQFINEIINRNDFDFAKKVLMINNVNDVDSIKKLSDELVNKKIIDEYHIVKQYENEVLKYFNLEKSSFGKGYYYSIAEMMEIYLYRNCDFLVHFSGDSVMEKKYNWIIPALEIFQNNRDIVVVNPCWNQKYREAKKEAIKEFDYYYLGPGFSDQCYMIRLSEFSKQIYNHNHPSSERYPKYADNLFEKRVDAWMRNCHKYRATLKNISYLHKNWTTLSKFSFSLFNRFKAV
ncbi:MAG: hypothetical protein COY66_01655 [Candidatus Kerfeldbacteria bacterium CG_4_10_14_0_8_um_filter_42_10]|uniref:Glycosyltransferase n=1 Tax=Candidatus Kerfeldbacteria bacterium CG_4_10_14_0_8_um_filter_42_10 TaxID=2014248 RepID=A0A2M7RKB4_9BACT|nr:MAG: hypothetical protein COY66_01655 [Candidatus Kerfeldbacteria bacterium CG_4_10_14_0_8_um_filter_42_10]